MSNETPPFQDHPAVRAVIGFGRVPDAVDAAIERHRAARDELQRAYNGVNAAMTASKRAEAEADAVFLAASNADGAAWADLLATRPGDVPGAVRLLRYVSGSPASEVVEDPQDLLRQLLATVEAGEKGSAAGEGASAGAEPQVVAEPDPALAVVAEYRAAWDGLGAAIEAAGGAGVPEVPEAESVDSAAYTRLRTVRPTTPAGFRALAETWAWRLEAERVAIEDGEPGSTASHAAASLIAGAGVCVPAAISADGNDAVHGLIEAHREAYAAWSVASKGWTEADPNAADHAAQQAAADERAADELRAFRRLFSARPTTLAGTAALASYLGEAIRQTRVDADPTEGELALGTIAAALYGIAPGGAFSGDAPATVSPPQAAAADAVERLRTASPEHNLTALPVEQLGHLYDALLPFEDLIGRSENAPCFWEGDGTVRTAAGDIIYREAARLEGILKAIAKEIERRAPADDGEREIRLATLLRHRMLGGGLPTSRALLTEALAACED